MKIFLVVLLSAICLFSVGFFLYSNDDLMSAIFCVICIFIVSCLYLFIVEMEFLSLLYLLVHVGAVIILFLFVVMTFRTIDLPVEKNLNGPIEIVEGVFIVLVVFNVLIEVSIADQESTKITSEFVDYVNVLLYRTEDIQLFGYLMYTQFFLYFLLISLIMLVVLVGVIFLQTFEKADFKLQSDYKERNLSSVS